MAAEAQETAQVDLAPGDKVGGRFQISEILGRGGMATVYRADHLITGRPVALKVATTKLVNSPLMVARFLREARAVSAIRHPHAIQVLDVFEDEAGRPIMVMELLQGEDMGHRLAAGRLSVPETLQILVPVLKALAHAHANGIVHRDLKPDNIFLSRSPKDGSLVPKVHDFGIAKVLGDKTVDPQTMKLTSTGVLLGTPYYMSPEQVSGLGDLDHRTDIWSFGILAYEALVGELPFSGENFGQVFAKILQIEPAPLVALVPGIPQPVADVIHACLSKRREDRPANCGEIAAVFEPLADLRASDYPAPAISHTGDASSSGAFDSISGVHDAAEGTAPTLLDPDASAWLRGPRRAWLLAALLALVAGAGIAVFFALRDPEPEIPADVAGVAEDPSIVVAVPGEEPLDPSGTGEGTGEESPEDPGTGQVAGGSEEGAGSAMKQGSGARPGMRGTSRPHDRPDMRGSETAMEPTPPTPTMQQGGDDPGGLIDTL